MQYAIKDRQGAVHPEDSRKAALRTRHDFGGQVVASKNDDGNWKPWKRRRVFLWVFLTIQAVFLVWLIAGIATAGNGNDTATQVAQVCGHGGWQGLFKSYADCSKHYGVALNDAGNTGTAIGAALIVVIWIVVDFFVALGYGIYRLARR